MPVKPKEMIPEMNHKNPPTDNQLKLMCSVIWWCRDLLSIAQIRKALDTKRGAWRFLERYKPEMDARQKPKEPEVNADSVIKDVTSGTCPDIVAEIRGDAIADLLDLDRKRDAGKFYIFEHNKERFVSAAGLYRAVIQAVVESKDNKPREPEVKAMSIREQMIAEASDFVGKHPELQDSVNETLSLALSEIEDGGSEQNEYELFQNDLMELLENLP